MIKSTLKQIIRLTCLFFVLCFIPKIKCVKGSTLSASVTTKVLDKTSGKLYLGLGTNANEAIIAFERYEGYGNPSWSQVVPTTEISNSIEFLALATQRCETNPIIAAVQMGDEGQERQKKVLAFTSDFYTDQTSSKKANSGNLKDTDQRDTSGIVALAASNGYIFAAVKSENESSVFGSLGSGIAAIKITNNIQNRGNLTLSQTDAIAGSATIARAKAIDPSVAQIKIETDPLITHSCTLYWDEYLQRLYIGIEKIITSTVITVTSSPNPGARSVIVARVNTNGSLSYEKIAPKNAFEPGNETEIVGVRMGAEEKEFTLGLYNLRVMHTSTGKSYLIVNGGNGTEVDSSIVVPGNRIFALPLVDDNTNLAGTLAQYNEITNNGPFTNPATFPSELLKSTDPQANVGTGPVALAPNDTLSDIVVVGDTVFISINYTQDKNREAGVFYSQALFDEDGKIYRWTPWTKRTFPFYATTNGRVKFFDVDAANGKLWAVDGVITTSVLTTNWERRVNSQTPTSLLGNVNEDFKCGCFSYLDLDQSTRGLGTSSPARFALFGGFEQVAFVKTSTSFATTAPYDFNTASPELPYAQYVTQDFSLAENYVLTELPPKSGCVKVLEYSRRLETDGPQNYFFAGTQTGLYVFSKINNTGFSASMLDNKYQFTNGYWSKIKTISGSIIDMISSGTALYVLSFETTRKKPIKNVLYKIDFADTTTDMFDASNVIKIAENTTFATGSDLSQVKMFFATQVITTTNNADYQEELLLATNHGIYRSNSANGINNATDQQDAQWHPIDAEDTTVYKYIFAPDNLRSDYRQTYTTTILTTVWPIQVADGKNCLTFEKTNIRQLNGSFSRNMPIFDPQTFNANNFDCTGYCTGYCNSCNSFNYCNCNPCSCKYDCDTCDYYMYNDDCEWGRKNIRKKGYTINATDTTCINNKFETLDPISYFWTDGGRRFFIIKRTCDPTWINKLLVFPYDIGQWLITNPRTQILTNPALKQTQTFYWIGPIGATGIILAGTNSGVVALQ